jgi:hypothetical protein
MTEVVVVHTPTYVDVVEEKHVVEVAQELYTVEVYGAVGQRGPQGLTGPRGFTGPGLPIMWAKKGPVNLVPNDDSLRYRMPVDATLIGVSATMGKLTPPLGAGIVFHVWVEDTIIQTVTVPDGAVDVGEIVLNVPVEIGDHISISITQVGSTEPGESLSIFIRYEM